ncbi:D-aminoacyl-tRNA deacylase [Hugenholtzia roseola]|uniref:D-aminoacyl-tRNA deacylase n=1 Tax=Hugenholtzia roseola TaxID=1002 RepID=UPI000412B7E3|nr:D-aminoacyl-tRNA deacylase [Hugenholtzia roseola]
MKAVIQRVSQASVEVEGKTVGSISQGLLVLLGISQQDTPQEVEKLAQKIVNLRIFSDAEGKMNRSLLESEGEVLLVSQFTLMADTRKGNRPSFAAAAAPPLALPLYEAMQRRLSELLQKDVPTGVFGAMMQVRLCNEGPVTIILDTEK